MDHLPCRNIIRTSHESLTFQDYPIVYHQDLRSGTFEREDMLDLDIHARYKNNFPDIRLRQP
jgi:hypothetical protein